MKRIFTQRFTLSLIGFMLIGLYKVNAQAPTITSFSPTSGEVASTVTITGTGFNTTATNNIVFFGATSAIVTSASATSLTVTVPSGATFAPITVLNTATALATYSTQFFHPTFSPNKDNITVDDIAVVVNITTGLTPQSISNGDIDGDGKPDLVIANYSNNTVSVLRNIGNSGTLSFATKVDFATGLNPYSVALGDINGDGKLDLAIANSSSNTISILRNTSSIGSISFNTKVDFTAAQGPQFIAIGDIDGDGKPDLAVSNYANATNPGNIVSIFRNTGNINTISFATKVDFISSKGPRFIVLGDIDGNGKPDLAVANDIGSVSILRNTSSVGSISFASKVDFGAYSNPQSVAIGDIDGDGKLDLAVANSSNFISVFLNTSMIGSITFSTRLDLPAAQSLLKAITIGDLNGDGKLDLVSCNYGSNSVSIFKNKSSIGSISFETKLDFGSGTNPTSLVIGDINGDNKPDLMAANFASNSIAILINNLQSIPPKIISIAPTHGKEGDTVFITGKYFNVFSDNNVVFFGASQATVCAATDSTLTVIVPSGATFAPINVLNVASTFSASSPQYFNPIFSPNKDSITTADIAPKVDFTAGFAPTSVAIGDVDGDDKSDMVIVNNSSNTVSVLLNTGSNGTVSFAPKVDFVTGIAPISLAIGDLNGDGKLDLVVVNNSSNSISVLRNTSIRGMISFATKVDIPINQSPYSVCIGDLDGDGRPDLATTDVTNNRVYIWRNNGNINTTTFFWASTTDITTGTSPIAITIGDTDGDGKPDLVTANNYGSGIGGKSVSILRNTSSISLFSFAPKVDIGTGAATQSVAVGDLNGDGKLDIAISNYGNNTVSLFANTSSIGTSSFAPKVDFITGSNPTQVTIGDINGDGKPDLATSNSGSNTVSILRNIGNSSTISFYNKVDFTTGSSPNSVAIGDINGDGKPDLTLANASSNDVSVLRNNSQLPPTITILGTLKPFYSCVGNSSAQQTFKISGVGLSSNLLLTAPLGFEVSTNSGFGFGDSISLTPIFGTVINKLIFIRIKSSAIGSPSGNVVCTSTDATTNNIAVSGLVNAVSITTSTNNISICPSALPYTWNGRTYNANITDTVYLTNSLGCDSVTILNLIVKSTSTSTNIVSICSSALPYTWNGRSYNTNRTDTIYLANSVGCDSVTILKLTVKPVITSTNIVSICSSELPFIWNGRTYNTNRTDTIYLINSLGCDSLTILKLTVKPTSTFTKNIIICPSSLPYTWNNRIYNTSQVDTIHLTNSSGCDSAAILNLHVPPSPNTSNINGSSNVLRLDTLTYSVSGLQGSTFNWSSTKGIIQSGAGTNQIQIKWNALGTDTLKVIETSSQGCVGVQNTLLVNVSPASSINEIFSSKKISIYPNPTTGMVNISSSQTIDNIEVFDVTGKQVLSQRNDTHQKHIELDLSAFGNGIYFIQTQNQNAEKTLNKVVISK